MKFKRICPKCGCVDIVKIVGARSRVGLFKVIHFNYHICVNCGYTERWMHQKDLQNLKNMKSSRYKFFNK